MKPLFIDLMVLLVLIGINSFFAASEISLISLNDNKIRVMAEDGERKAQMISHLLSEPSRFLATSQIGITLAGFLASAFAAQNFSGRLVDLIQRSGVSIHEEWLNNISLVIITLVLSYFTLVLGELVPKRLAMQKSEQIAMSVAKPLTFLSVTFYPFVKFLTLSANFFIRLFGVDPHAEDQRVTEEEIRMMVDVGEEIGAIHETEKQMINNIFEFNNKDAADIMTHRTDIAALPISAGFAEVTAFVNEEKYSRIPVYGDNIDDIIGVLHAKDLIQILTDDDARKSFNLAKTMRRPYFAPDSKKTDELFKEMQRNQVHLAIIIDEHGGTAGIVSLEDLLEEIVGEIFDEEDEEVREIEAIDENTYLIQGSTDLDTVKDFLEVDLPVAEYDTLSGFIVGQLGRIPGPEEKPTVEFGGLVFKVQAVEEKRIAKVKVSRRNPVEKN